jgi:molecular chaperone GrpE
MTSDETNASEGSSDDREESVDEVEVASGGLDDTDEERSADAAIDDELAEILSEVDGDPVARERDEYLDTLRRLQAEFDNYRKRMSRQQTELVDRATQSLVERLLPTLDALDLALAHTSGEEDAPDRQALTQIAALVRDTLTREGLERIDAIGAEFDPNVHDAVVHLPHEDGSEETRVIVAEVLRAGYQLKGKVVRPAMVQVRG